jgi:hypothetical protein
MTTEHVCPGAARVTDISIQEQPWGFGVPPLAAQVSTARWDSQRPWEQRVKAQEGLPPARAPPENLSNPWGSGKDDPSSPSWQMKKTDEKKSAPM